LKCKLVCERGIKTAARLAFDRPIEQAQPMVEVLKTSDVVRLSYLRAVLKDGGIETAVFDAGANALWGGAAFTSRLMVEEDDLAQAKRLIAAAEQATD
jgi:hypothetical protein